MLERCNRQPFFKLQTSSYYLPVRNEENLDIITHSSRSHNRDSKQTPTNASLKTYRVVEPQWCVVYIVTGVLI